VKSVRFAFLVSVGLIALFVGCSTPNPCSGIDCLNYGLCNDGECLCLAGYEGTVCDTISRDRILGSYVATQNCNQDEPFTYQMFIAAGPQSVSDLIIGNFGNGVIGVHATLNGDYITIPQQHLVVQSGAVDVHGTGFIGDSTIAFSYFLNDGTTDFHCNFILPLP